MLTTSFTDTTTTSWDDALSAVERGYELGWGDGLPIVPPTVGRVAEFIGYAGRPPDDVLGELPERRRVITVEKAAANAVMAGCLPEYFPVVLAATEAMLDPVFNLVGPSSSMGGSAVLCIVNGPIREQIGLNSRNNLFGPGQSRQRHYRPLDSPDPDERLRRHPRPFRPECHRASRQIHVLYRGGRG